MIPGPERRAEPISCSICGASVTRVRYACARDYITLEPFSVLQCDSCGVGFTWPVPLDLAPFYPQQYREYNGYILWALKVLYRWRARQWAAHFTQAGNLLEIGCGPGIMLHAFREMGWEVTGLERSDEAAEVGRRLLGLDIRSCSVGDLPEGPKYDLIILFQVLEHMPQPIAIVRECARRLKPGGRIVLSVPDFESWQARFGGTGWMHLDVPRHLYHFSSRSISGLLRRCGFDQPSIAYASFEHDPIGWVQTVLNRVISPPNTLLRHLMSIEAPPVQVAASLALAVFLAMPSIGLSLASWIARRGSIMTISATATLESGNSAEITG